MQKPIYPYGPIQLSAIIKSKPEDFRVTEELGFEPTGEGEHLFLWVEKTDLTTMELIDCIGVDFKVETKHIGRSGLKDKRAITRQWLSLHLPGQQASLKMPDLDAQQRQYKILKTSWHDKKLRPGTHKFNHFSIFLRDLSGFSSEVEQQLESIKKQGFANYFGEQRFGNAGDNVAQALKQLSRRKLGRNKKGLFISALRSHLFNQILTSRISEQHWLLPLEGDVFMLTGTHSIFAEALSDEIIQRFNDFDISNTASLYGEGETRLQQHALEIEQAVFESNPQVTACLASQQSKLQMRALRVPADELNYQFNEQDNSLKLEVKLPSGSYLTSLLNHFVETRMAAKD